jgi:general secretion pathway protein B
MSFILDALKKSENDRQRQSGPALFEVRVPPPRSKLPLLAIIIVSLLVVNLGVVGWIMLRKPAAAAVPATPAAAATPPAVTPPPYTAQPPPVVPPQGYAQYPQAGTQQPNVPPPQGYNGASPSNGYGPSGANNGYPPPPNSYSRVQEPNLTDQGAGLPQDSQQEQYNPDDYAPARDTPPPGTGAGRVTLGTVSGLPTYEEAATQTTIPPLHMDLHSYAADPTKRFVLINMRRLYEGQALPEGPKVESINNDSAIMSYNGTKFVLNKD